MNTKTLDTQLKNGRKCFLDGGEVVLIGELASSPFREESFVFAYEGRSSDGTPFAAKLTAEKRILTVDGNNISTNGNPVSIAYFYPKTPASLTDDNYLGLQRLVSGAA